MSTSGETGLFRLATGLIGLHVLDDNFVQPQPGTGIADHLVSGLVPLTLLALAAWAYPRLRPGYRGLLALAMALPAVLSGVEAIHYGRDTGLSGDDFTGLAALATAPLLLGLGTLTLWRSRRTGDRLWRRYPRRALKFAAGPGAGGDGGAAASHRIRGAATPRAPRCRRRSSARPTRT